MKNKTLEIAQEILESVIVKHFPFYLWQTEHNEDGTVNKLYTEKADIILNDLINTIKKYEQ